MSSSSPLDTIPSQQKFEANELATLLDAIREKYANCEVLIQTKVFERKRQRVLIFQQGNIAFCGNQSPKLDDFVDLLRSKINPDWIDRIFESSEVNLNEQMNAKQFCDRLLQMRVIQKNNLFKTLLSAFLLSLEPLWAASGIITVKPLPKQETYAVIDWRIFKAALEKRAQIWKNFTLLDHGINSIPIITESGFKALQDSHAEDPAERDKVIQFIEQCIDGRSDIVALAKRRNVDPVSMAQRLIQGIEKGWLSISDEVKSASKQRGNVLIVDDNATTRKLLVTILQEFYDTHSTSGGLGAVSLIPTKNIDLVLVSQSVPVGTSLQLCKVIRQNPKYQNMPFLVISSNENFFERTKAKMVGVTEYLTQPLDRTKILYTLDHHLS